MEGRKGGREGGREENETTVSPSFFHQPRNAMQAEGQAGGQTSTAVRAQTLFMAHEGKVVVSRVARPRPSADADGRNHCSTSRSEWFCLDGPAYRAAPHAHVTSPRTKASHRVSSL